ncbi:MAG: metallophosphoesterase [Cyclobacteriaceae bacterium]|nr:metallophosphoesterase [Cyclobacteriaceae bacterium]
MNGKISILHISDLHRSKGCEISNVALLSSLLKDKDRYSVSESPKIKAPDIIVVSGDVIRGSIKPDGSEEEVQNQYDEAISFLNDLVKYFLGGDKNRIVIIPGNHDIDWKFSKESMEKIDNAKVFDENNTLKWEILKEALNQNSITRWSWKDLSFYKIVDADKYNKRLQAFANCYTTFYEGKRTYSIDPRAQYDIFDYPQYNLTIAAFNSCYNNDHLRLVGDIHPECIANVNLKLRELQRKGRLILSTWHHNTKGLPYDSTYMDNSRLKNFIDSGISIGFHGHQHKTELIHEFSDVIEQKKIIVFSAGTLCGGPNELPVGNNRQYNIIEIDSQEESPNLQITLHVREKTDSSPFDNPIWTAGRIDSKNVSHYTLEIEKPIVSDASTTFLEIEKLMNDGNYPEVKQRLLNLDIKNDFVRKFLVECILQTEDFELALKVFSDPQTNEEAITLLNATIQLGNKVQMREMSEKVKSLSSISKEVADLIKKIEALTR